MVGWVAERTDADYFAVRLRRQKEKLSAVTAVAMPWHGFPKKTASQASAKTHEEERNVSARKLRRESYAQFLLRMKE